MRRALAVAALLALVACSGGGGGGESTEITLAARTVPFLLPSYLPTGFVIQAGSHTEQGLARDAYAAAIGRPAANGAFDDVIVVIVDNSTNDRAITAREQASIRSVDVNGVSARAEESPLQGASVDWWERQHAVQLSGPSGSVDKLIDMARRVQLSSATADAHNTKVASVPDGYQLISESKFTDYLPELSLAFRAVSPAAAIITVQASLVGDLPLIFGVAGGDHVEKAKVRSFDALVSARTRRAADGTSITQRTIAWHETPDVIVSVTGNASVDDLMPVAVGLRRVSAKEWVKNVPLPKQQSTNPT